MDFDVPSPVKYPGEIQNLFTEVVNTEKKLFTLIHSKGLLDNEVHGLYLKACSDYENIILNDLEVIKLEEVEYFLWKLHYMHIEEFRKRIRKCSANSGVERFRSFLSEATAFYENLIKKIRINCGEKVETLKFNRIQYVSHRFLICLGDIARYQELCKKSDARDWSVAATYYLEAARISPDSGNPHNQLALLATYVGDSFLALYHCLRSLAVKEPFPDAEKNLMLLIEENRSSDLNLLSSDAQVDFSRPYERIFLGTSSNGSNHSLNNDESKTDLWTFFIRMISFFLVRTSSMEGFPCALTSTMRELEALVAKDEEELQVSLESYQRIDSSRKGPHRAIQLVSIFIFIIHSVTENDEETPFAELALATTFLCIGRFIERCLKSTHPKICPFLPCVLSFVEWLVINLDKVEEYAADERVTSTMLYFFYVLTHLLNRLYQGEQEISSGITSLWEDHELRGFERMAEIHVGLDFTTANNVINWKNEDRSSRIFNAVMKIAKNSNKPRKWILYDEKERKFCQEQGEEEEVIVFKPITRRNSAPVSDVVSEEPPFDECLRRVTSLGIQKTHTQNDKPLKFQEPLFKDSTTCAVGPPSLNGWVRKQEIPKIDREKGIRNSGLFDLSPIDELAPASGSASASASLIDLSIDEHKDSAMAYVTPVPSAPLLPDDSVWFPGNSPSSHLFNKPMVSNDGYSTFVPKISGIVDGYPQFSGMSSSEWLYHYRNNQNLERDPRHTFPVHLNTNDISSFGVFDQWGNYLVSENPMVYVDSSQLLSTPLIYGPVGQIGEKLLPSYQRSSSPYAYLIGSDLRAEQPPLLQYLKEREWQLQRESHLKGSTFIGK